MADNGTVEAREKREYSDANCERTTRNAGEDCPIPTVTLLAHDLEIRRIKRRYRIAQAVLFTIVAVMFAACIACNFKFIY